MKREIIITSDGSTTIYLPDWNEQYHSKHGAIQEAYHVFIKSGLALQTTSEISILEIGFGTGLNCFITFLENSRANLIASKRASKKINYVGVEAYPVVKEEVEKLNYVAELKAEKDQVIFDKMHNFSWDKKHEITPDFSLTKRQQFFTDIDDKSAFDLIYFDAFGAEHQPDLWTEAIFKKMFEALKENGILVTYCAKGSVRRAMQSVGFTVERLAGPPGKREMLRAIKQA
ncbi:tRNA (5-methylaminomethyl-2-thiouridine)(34)-methyltransferase MnmD [Tenacibaculum piscium]|uniref:tRNA (5-methylaminomethyl-2-thiouridine)(34)-methyltransferase MnmD n=1 Tax=Tenacibaculum piscium TaxID=1458515 RepID=UPI001F450B89|nr:tRNA (5-methylaminomethyl-2-thiouridine)(34)-methyltransferase MnmD [Tenacibaculum piscium]MCG8182816.1 tRNA (5-methylaminomethyl-2-thiouridine)(34)-methyltransferase MnmD [Tenacibaculum piscium]MCG8204208.1 tRNA (5-methylaminomethyl-2-thiouridine)(34)-methyltransferase MnmD [Tenacibaculum piscium]